VLVLEREDVSVSLHHPGFDEGLIVRADVETMFQVWLGRIPLEEALDSRRVQIEGPPQMSRAFTGWILGSHVVGAEGTAPRAS
jgi:hypothetical protein